MKNSIFFLSHPPTPQGLTMNIVSDVKDGELIHFIRLNKCPKLLTEPLISIQKHEADFQMCLPCSQL